MTLIERLGALSFLELRDGRLHTELGQDVTDELLGAIEQAEKQEPFMWACNSLDETVWETSKHKECEHCIPLYTTPPAAPAQEPTEKLPKMKTPEYNIHGVPLKYPCY